MNGANDNITQARINKYKTCKYNIYDNTSECGLFRYGTCKDCYKMIDLKVGQDFYLINGDWNGSIVEIDEVKCIHVNYTGDNFKIEDSAVALLELK